jgi:hypothetical protein
MDRRIGYPAVRPLARALELQPNAGWRSTVTAVQGASDAQRQRQKLLTDRARQVQKLAADVAPFPNLVARVRPVVDHVADEPDGYDLWDDYLRVPHVDPMVATLRTMGIGDGSRDLDDLAFCAWASDEATAETTTMPDGSGLVVISDAMLGVCIHLAMVNALWLDPLLGKSVLVQLARASKASREGKGSRLSLIGGALVRYHLLHLRLHGLPAKLTPALSESGTRMAEMICLYAIRFICAHEAAHYLLGHPNDPAGVMSADRLPLIRDSQELEYEADEVAAQAVVLAGRRDGWPEPAIITAGVMLAICGLFLLERGTFARLVRTHPPVEARMRRVSRLLDTKNIDNLLLGMSHAIDIGGDPSGPLPPAAWDLMSCADEVIRDSHAEEYLQTYGKLDSMLTRPTGALVGGLSGLDPTGGDLAAGLEHACQRDIPQALRAWGVPPRRQAELLERRRSLGFYGAMDTLLLSDAVTRLPNSTEQKFAAAALTTVLTREKRW